MLDVELSRGAAISGRVRGPSGEAVAGGVAAFVREGVTWRSVSYAPLDEDGRYEIRALPAGTYRLRVQPDDGPPTHGSPWSAVWYPAADTAAGGEDLVVEHEEELGGIDVEVERSATVSGHVVVDGSPTPDPSPPVYGGDSIVALRYVGPVSGPPSEPDSSVRARARASTTSVPLDPDGTYLLTDVEPGRYVVSFLADGYAPSFHGDTGVFSEATVVTVERGATVTGVDGVLRASGSLAGRVRTQNGGAARAAVTAYVSVADGRWLPFATDTADDTGRYAIRRLPPGQYRLHFSHLAGHEWWYDAATLEESPVVPLATGQRRSGLDAVVGEPSVVVGTVTDEEGVPAAGVYVEAAAAGSPVDTVGVDTLTAADGTYRLPLTTTGRYRIRIDGVEVHGERPWAEGSAVLPPVRITGGTVRRLDLVAPRLGPVTIHLPSQASDLRNHAVYAVRGGELVADRVRDADIVDDVLTGYLPVGVYRVRIDTDHWWPDAVDANSAADLVIDGDTEAVRLRNVVPRSGPRVRNLTPPAITGEPEVGRTLTATPGVWSVPVSSFTYRWLADGIVVRDSDSPTFTPTADLYGRALKVEVRAVVPGLLSTAARSIATPDVGDDMDQIEVVDGPYIAGTPELGRPLVAVPGTWLPGRATFSYQWMRGRSKITGATSASYVPTIRDAGARLTVLVVAHASGLPPVVAASESTVPVLSTLTVARRPAVRGQAIVGRLLTARIAGVFRPGARSVTYRWQRDGRAIPAAHTARYRLRRADLGHRIRVVVSGSLPGATPAKAFSRATHRVSRRP